LLAGLVLVLILGSLGNIDNVLAEGATNPWPMLGHDAQRSNLSPYPGPATPLLKWKYPATSVGYSPVIGLDGTIYLSVGSELRTLKPDGTLKWKTALGGSGSSPALAEDGVIYITARSCTGDLLAFSPDGSLKWKYTFVSYGCNPYISEPVIAPDGSIVYTTGLGYDPTPYGPSPAWVVAVNPDGTLKWSYLLVRGWYSPAPAIGLDGTVFVQSSWGYFYAFQPNGVLKWVQVMGPGQRPSIGHDGTVYATYAPYRGNCLSALNPANGAFKWIFCPPNGGLYDFPSFGPDGTIYFATYYQNYVYALNPNGTMKWRYPVSGPGWFPYPASPLVDKNNVIYLGETNGNILTLNPDGSLKWRFQVGGNLWGQFPVLDAFNTLYIYSVGQGLLAIGGDNVPPTTTATLSGTFGNNNWYTTDVQVTLTATDNEGGSGVAKTEYSFDGISWNVYSAPFTISSEGMTTLFYRSTDNAGNVEPTKTETIKIDKTPPQILINSPEAKDYLSTEKITINFEDIDTVSGVATATANIDGTPVINGQEINFKTLSLGSHTFTVNSTDQAGNSGEKSVIFNVVPVPFSSFSAKVKAEIGQDISENKLKIRGNFTLGEKSDEIDIPVEIVSLEFKGTTDGVKFQIPAGSFKWFEHPKKPEKSEFRFEGTIENIPVEMKIKPFGGNNYEFKFETEGLNLCWITSPLEVVLKIGDDYGKIEAAPEIEGLENWSNVCPTINTPGISPD